MFLSEEYFCPEDVPIFTILILFASIHVLKGVTIRPSMAVLSTAGHMINVEFFGDQEIKPIIS